MTDTTTSTSRTSGPPAPLARGLWGILATPFAGPSLAVDVESLRREVSFFAEIPATGVVALGVFGEGASLDSDEQRRVVETVRAAGAGLPMVVGLSARATAPAIEQAHRAVESAGPALVAVMVQANSADPAVLVPHLTAIHEATGAGVVLQDYPVASGVHISVQQILQTLEHCPFVVGVKSEAPPTGNAIARLTAHTAVPVFGGLGGVGLLDELAGGASGAMTGFSRPEALLEALQAWESGGMAAAHDAFARWLPLANFEGQPGIGLAVRKEALRMRGIFDDGAVRPPAPPAPAEMLPMLRQHLEALNLIESTEET